MKITANTPDGSKYSVVDAQGNRISGVFSFDTETKNVGVYLTSRDPKGKTIVAKDDKGNLIRLYKKVKGAKLIDRKTGEEVK
jgi:hypothetical protein